ncbi:MAG: PEGA domain-containing protein [Methanoregulaceae archaeon]|jgi:hypothetical protein|nr:PEGA domain-containing protein [Methanoregulaceae archaeon]
MMNRKNDDISIRIITITGFLVLVCLVLVTGISAAGTKTAYLGDMVTLSGSSPGSDIVYLFMTGPNLPLNGVALNNINRRADMGGFATADVDPDGRWTYKWYTNQIGGKIDTGTYTVWVTDRPVDRSHLSGSNFVSIPVLLQQPGIVATSSTATGGLLVRTIPEGAVLFLNGENRGITPVTIPDLPAGSHVISVSSTGYQNLTTQVVVKEGALTEVSIPLTDKNGSLYVNTTPPGAEISIDGKQSGLSPILLSDLVPGNHTLDATKAGFNATRQEVQVIGGHMMVAQLSLGQSTPVPGAYPPATRAPGIAPLTLFGSMIGTLYICRRLR